MTDSITGRPKSGRLRRLAVSALGSSAFVSARSVYRLARGEERSAPFPLRHKLEWWRRGFRADSAAIYDLPRNDWRDYVSDYMRDHRCATINPAPTIFDHKLLFRSFLLTQGFKQAETVAVVAEGNILLRPFNERRQYVTPEELERWLLEDGGCFVMKPQGGSRGQDIFLVEARDGALVRRRGTQEVPFNAAALGGVTIVERRIEQGDFWRELSPSATNTVRAVTMWMPGEGAPFIGCAVQRMGTAGTAPTDNWSGGGICARIDLATGRLGVGRMNPLKRKGADSVFTHHPDTGVRIEGAVLPHWDRICDVVLRAAAGLPLNRYVGWDVVVDGAGSAVIIEANKNTDVNLLQVHGGLLLEPRVRQFYEAVGALR
jgi:hypothetical protein